MMRRPLAQRLADMTHPEPNSGCWLFTGAVHRDGYGCINVSGKRKAWAHRVAWQVAHGPIPTGKLVCHTCDVRCCVNPDHLFIGTNDDNVNDMLRKQRHARGERNGLSKLTENAVAEIRALYASRTPGKKWGLAELSRKHGVRQTTIDAAAKGKTWRLFSRTTSERLAVVTAP